MALSRRSGARFQASIWPGFVDAMTALLLVLMFVLSIFMIVQFVLRETITGQETELHELSAQVASLADALGLERNRSAELEGEVGALSASLAAARDESAALYAALAEARDENATLGDRIADFEARVAQLLLERDAARDQVATLEGDVATLEQERAALAGDKATLEQALASVRSELDASTEAARLAAARREALEALAADLRRRAAEAAAENTRLSTALAEAETALSEEEQARLAEAEAARLLRERLQNSQTELTAMTLALEEERKRAEDTLTLLAAAETARDQMEAARDELQARIDGQLTEAEKQAALLAVAQSRLAEQEAASAEAQRRVTLLNQQIAALREQLGGLQGLLDAAAERDREAKVQIDSLGTQLNAALAQVADEQRRRAELEEAERKRLEAENLELERYRSDFFGKLRQVLAGREGVRVVGDRFVFSSEVLFQPGSADLAPEGQDQIASVAALLLDVAREIPAEVNWILRVDGHTDITPLSRGSRYADNWELSQARALSVVRFMVEELDFPADRLAATGFGEFQPVAEGTSPEALAQNRRIELKLTER